MYEPSQAHVEMPAYIGREPALQHPPLPVMGGSSSVCRANTLVAVGFECLLVTLGTIRVSLDKEMCRNRDSCRFSIVAV